MITLKSYLEASPREQKKMEAETLKRIEAQKKIDSSEKNILASKEFKSILQAHRKLINSEHSVKVNAEINFAVDYYNDSLKVTDAYVNEEALCMWTIVEKSKLFKDMKAKCTALSKRVKALASKFDVEESDIWELLYCEDK